MQCGRCRPPGRSGVSAASDWESGLWTRDQLLSESLTANRSLLPVPHSGDSTARSVADARGGEVRNAGVGGLVQHATTVGAARGHPTSRVRSAVLCPGRSGLIQRIRSPRNPVRFNQRRVNACVTEPGQDGGGDELRSVVQVRSTPDSPRSRVRRSSTRVTGSPPSARAGTMATASGVASSTIVKHFSDKALIELLRIHLRATLTS